MCARKQPSLGSSLNDNVNDVPNLLVHAQEQGKSFGSTSPLRSGDITFCMSNRNYHLDKVSAVLHVRCGSTEHGRNDFCASFEFSNESPLLNEVDVRREFPLTASVYFAGCSHNDAEQPVFVRVIQVGKKPEERREVWVSSMVRLHALDSCPHSRGEWVNFPLTSLVSESTISILDNERETSPVGRRILPRLVNCNRIYQMIENRPKIMHCVPKNERPLFDGGFGRVHPLSNYAVLCKIRTGFCMNAIWGQIEPSSDLLLEDMSVFVCSSQLRPDAS